jgi:hypothetical protein
VKELVRLCEAPATDPVAALLRAARSYKVADDTRQRALSAVVQPETIATGRSIREIARLRRTYGGVRWRKRRGMATLRLCDGTLRSAEVHWYEADGVGRKEVKIKHLRG